MRALYLLCCECRRAWIAPVAASCCGERPLVVSPWSTDARAWFRYRLAGDVPRRHEVGELANFTSRDEVRAMLWRGVERRGRIVALGDARRSA